MNKNNIYFGLINMPLVYNSLVIEYTSKCNAQCDICYQGAGPKGSDQIGNNTIDNDLLKKVLTDALKITTLNSRFHLSGGETFLFLDKSLELFRYAKKLGYKEITAVTNGFWAKNENDAFEIAEKLRDAGITSLEISWDYWHFKYIDSNLVSNCIDACKKTGIEANLRLLATKSHNYHESLSVLRKSSLKNVDRISCNQVFPTGRAGIKISNSDFNYDNTINSSCHSTFNLTVNANGNVYPCCSSLDQTENFSFGNIYNTDIDIIAKNMNSLPLLRLIAFCGVKALLPILKESGIVLEKTDFTSMCTMCWNIFSNKDYVDILSKYFNDAIIKAIDDLIN